MKNKFNIALVYIIIFFNSNLFSAENNKILKVGLLVPLSGAYSELGNSILYSLQLALEEINDKKVFINNAATIDGSEAEAGIITDILSSGFIVSTGSGSILLSEVEYEDGRLFIPKIGDRFNEQ